MVGELPLLDQDVLDRLKSDVGPESAAILLTSLKAEILNGQAKLAVYVSTGDMHMLETQSHALKSAARSFGAMQLGGICRQLELSAKEKAAIALQQGLLSQFNDISRKTLDVLKV